MLEVSKKLETIGNLPEKTLTAKYEIPKIHGFIYVEKSEINAREDL